MVLDFVNEADQIQKAFEPYYETTLLAEQTDPNVLYQLQAELDDYHFYAEEDVDTFVEVYFKGHREDLAKLYALLDPVVDRVAAAPRDEQETFRRRLNDFVRLYAFLAQILPFAETDWEKRFHYYRFLLRRILQRLFARRDDLPQELRNQVTIEFYRTRQTFEGTIPLGESRGELRPVGVGARGGSHTAEEKDPLSVILEELNQIFGEKVNGDTPGAIQHLQRKLDADIALQKGAEANPPKTFRLLFDQVVEERFAEMIDNYFEFYRRVTDDPKAKERLFDWLFGEYRRRKGE
jgi:type I restriction enzyme R subunit